MDIELYRKQKLERQIAEPHYRRLCQRCLQPTFSCYCALIEPVPFPAEFIILTHPIETRRRIATGRMAHLCLPNSQLIRGESFATHLQIENLVGNPSNHCTILYPGNKSLNLSAATASQWQSAFPQEKKQVIFVIDGTWNTAKKMLNRSPNLAGLQRICFTPAEPSGFRIRKQPRPECYSTIEAIHQTIELFTSRLNFVETGRPHDRLIEVFRKFVDRQIALRLKYPKTKRVKRKRVLI